MSTVTTTTRLLLLVRHGEPVAGGAPERLTTNGVEQSRLLGERLAGLEHPVRRLWHSPLPRARETACIVSAALPGVPMTEDPSLTECTPCRPDPDTVTASVLTWFDGVVSAEQLGRDAASGAAARQRWLHPPAAEEPVELDVAVSHGNLIRWLTASALGRPGAWLQLLDYHAAVWTFALRPGRPVVVIGANDVGHLPARLRGGEYPAELRV